MHENTRSKNKIPQRFSLHFCKKVSKIISITLSSVIFLWLNRAYIKYCYSRQQIGTSLQSKVTQTWSNILVSKIQI